jgi:DNA-binding NarL/FixJ family response regulator
MLHLSSHIEARNNFGRTAASGVEFPTLDSRRYRPDKAVTQANVRPLDTAVEEACLVAEASANAGHFSRATQSSSRTPNSTRAAKTPRDSVDIDVPRAHSDSEHLNGVNGKKSGAAKLKPGIVVIHCRAVFRDCFVLCLEIAYKDHEIFSFASVAEWCSSKQPNALAAAVVIFVIESGDEFNAAGFELLESEAANIPVIIVSDIDDFDHIARALKSGVRGYIPTNLPFNIAVEAVRLVKAGGTFVPASSFIHDRSEQPKASAPLTERQLKVIEEIRHGKANKQIAYELNMSEHTVKVHLRHIMRKLRARNRTEVAVLSEDLFARSKDHR